jgi:transcriptional regulator with XRE-family HTH domain
MGDVLRSARQQQGRTLREVSGAARVSLGYLSEVERGQKEASSELLSSICSALDLPMSAVLHQVSARVAAIEGTVVEAVAPAASSADAPHPLDEELAAVTSPPAHLAAGRSDLVSAA